MAKQTTSLKVGKFDILIEFKAVKYARLKIAKTGEITMSAPKFYTLSECAKFAQNSQTWIEKTLKRVKTNSLKQGQIRVLGEIYEMRILNKFEFENLTNLKPEFAEFDKFVKFANDKIYCFDQANFEIFKKNLARKLFNELIQKFLPYINRPVNSVTIRKMTTRWGSCNHKKGYINLALNLIEKDIKFIEYVVLHELTHLIFPHHQSEFYEFIAKIMPDFKERVRAEKI